MRDTPFLDVLDGLQCFPELHVVEQEEKVCIIVFENVDEKGKDIIDGSDDPRLSFHQHADDRLAHADQRVV